MKKQKIVLVVDMIYILIMFLSSLFYVFANFDKVISQQLGLAQLIFSIIVIIIFVLLSRSRNTGLPIVIYILYSVAQLVAAFNWFMYLSAEFHIFPGIIAMNWLGLSIHLLLIIWGISMIIIKKRV